jgi:polyhydroxyalkanoate synthase
LLWQEIQARSQKFTAGIAKYHAQPLTPRENSFPVLWQQGSARLYDYGAAKWSGTVNGMPLLVVPSLVNRAYILDLLPQKSFLQFLSAQGFRPFLMDWDAPSAAEQNFGLADYITERLLPAYEFITAQSGRPPAILGYCMGGNLALALAQLAVPKPPALALLATPWDFHARGMPSFTAPMAEQLMQMVDQQKHLPVDWLQSFFTALDPFGAVQKFIKFADMDAQSDSGKLFIALEDWLSDGVPLTPKVARDTMQNWYALNTPIKDGWRVANTLINPAALQLPILTVLPQHDRIVSPASAAALARAVPGAFSLTPDLGHIGMMVGSGAEAKVWQPLAEWLNSKL